MVKITSLQSRVLQFILQSIEIAGTPPTLREIAQHFGWKAVGSAQDVLASLRKKGYLEQTQRGRARQTLPTEAAYAFFGMTRQNLQSQFGINRKAANAQISFMNKSNEKNLTPPNKYQVQTLWDTPENIVTEEQRKEVTPYQSYQGYQFENNAVVIPLIGRVRAGSPHEAISRPDGYITLPTHAKMRDGKTFYAVEVDGYSMIGAGFLPGDTILVEVESQARSGDIALVAVGPDQEVTLKRFVLKGSQAYREALARTNLASVAKEQWPPALLVPENPDFEPIAFGLDSTDRVIGLVRSLYRSEIN